MAPLEPLRLTIEKRFETVLAAITAGGDFKYTPYKVSKHPISIEYAKEGPLYMVFAGDRVGPIDYTVGHLTRDETFYVSVQGIVHDRTDLTSKLEYALADVRKAIEDDALSGVAGTLGVLANQVVMDESAITGYHSEEEDDFVLFKQEWRVHITESL